ncbi:MAG: CRISPR-associated helicase Cas3' [Clostridiales bacterium]|nr:CRISPR-associated helicase Cas3' [Clostridiales bacterium]
MRSDKSNALWAKKAKDGQLLWLPLTVHMKDSAYVARQLWKEWLPDGVKWIIATNLSNDVDAERLVIFLAAAHDIGKAIPLFQAKISDPRYGASDIDEILAEKLIGYGFPIQDYRRFPHPSKTPHALATQLILEKAGCHRNIAVILGSHHGKPPDIHTLNMCSIGTYSENYYLGKEGKDIWSSMHLQLIDFALSIAGFSGVQDVPIPNETAQVLLSALVIMADWIASNEIYFPYIRPEDTVDLRSTNGRAQNAWAHMNLTDMWRPRIQRDMVDLFERRFSYTPYTMQKSLAVTANNVHDPGIIVIEAPMGGGKTEAALIAGEIYAAKTNRSGLFFALPTQATSDGIFPRICNWIGKLEDYGSHTIRLAHGKAQFNDEYQALKRFSGGANIEDEETSGAVVHEWFEGTKKSILADFVVGTIDQVLMAALKQKHVMLRHLGLANKVVIIDECHAYDAYMSRYLEMVLKWLGAYKVPVIVLSATLPSERREMVIGAYLNKNLSPKPSKDPLNKRCIQNVQRQSWIDNRAYPLITYSDGSMIKQQSLEDEAGLREVQIEFLEENGICEKLEELLSEGGCAGVIVNTVRRAQEIAAVARNTFGNETVRLLHSRFLAPDRVRNERRLMDELGKNSKTDRPQKRIVIGTQVLEQSLDIDFDVLITDICPMDLLLQRIGRLHRHNRTRPTGLSVAQCYIVGVSDEGFEKGSVSVYGEYLLMRTKALIPNRLLLPQDIPTLVQNAYDDSVEISPKPKNYDAAKDKWALMRSDKEVRARNFRIGPPCGDTNSNITDWLNAGVGGSDKSGEATVRDADESIEVLLVRENDVGSVSFLPWIENGQEIPENEVPGNNIAKKLARQSIRLPGALCAPWKIDDTIAELERVNIQRLGKWQESFWLKGQLFLILDRKFATSLGGYRLVYDELDGLCYEKEDAPSE